MPILTCKSFDFPEQVIKAYWHFLASGPQPNCSVISDSELLSVVDKPLHSGLIFYSFKSFYSYSNLLRYPGIQNIFISNLFQEIMEFVDTQKSKIALRMILSEIERLSVGRLKFVEDDNAPVKLFFQFTLEKRLGYVGEQYSGITQKIMGMSNQIGGVISIAPVNNMLESSYIIAHEVLHALGFNHLHEYPALKEKLLEIPEGLFCSIMPYPEKIKTNINTCKTNCNMSFWGNKIDIPFAILPGPLDIRLIRSYPANITYPDYVPQINMHAFGWNGTIGLLMGFIIIAEYLAVYRMSTAITRKMMPTNLSKRFSTAMADISFILMATAVKIENEMLILYMVILLAKFIGHDLFQQKIPNHTLRFITNAFLFITPTTFVGDLHPILLGGRLIGSAFVGLSLAILTMDYSPKLEIGKTEPAEEPIDVVIEKHPRRKVTNFFLPKTVKNDESLIKNTDVLNSYRA